MITDTITGLATLTCTIGIGRNQTLASLAVLRLLVRFPGFRFVLLASIREGLSGLALSLPWAFGGCDHPIVALIAGLVLLMAIWLAQGIRQARRAPPGSARN